MGTGQLIKLIVEAFVLIFALPCKDFGNFFKQIAVEIVVTIIVGINLSTSYSTFISFLCDFIQLALSTLHHFKCDIDSLIEAKMNYNKNRMD